MSFPSLEKAVLIPFPRDSDQPDTDNTITLDFNPASLQIEVTNSLEAGNGAQARQTVKETVSNLSFDAVFDSTHATIEVDSPEDLDVRRRTLKLVQLLGPPAGAQNSEGGGNRVPARVRFSWGTVIFDGVFSSYSETLDYFSPDGVPLRARVSIQLSEQEFQYNRDEDADLSGLGRESGDGGAGSAAASEDPLAEDVDDWSVADGFGLGFSAEFGLSLDASFGVSVGLEASFGLGASISGGFGLEGSFDFGIDVSAEIGVDVDLDVAAAVFGEGLFETQAGRDLNPAVVASAKAGSVSRPGAAQTIDLPWASAAPAPGTVAGRIAADVARARAAAPAVPGETVRAPLAGAPPTRLPAIGPPARAVFTPDTRAAVTRAGSLPSWEVTPPRSSDLAEDCCAICGGAVPESARRQPLPRPQSRSCRCAD